MKNLGKVEYRVRPVTRYVVTRYAERAGHAGPGRITAECSEKGEFDNEDTAYQVAYALCWNEHRHLGWPVGDERIQYPERRAVNIEAGPTDRALSAASKAARTALAEAIT